MGIIHFYVGVNLKSEKKDMDSMKLSLQKLNIVSNMLPNLPITSSLKGGLKFNKGCKTENQLWEVITYLVNAISCFGSIDKQKTTNDKVKTKLVYKTGQNFDINTQVNECFGKYTHVTPTEGVVLTPEQKKHQEKHQERKKNHLIHEIQGLSINVAKGICRFLQFPRV